MKASDNFLIYKREEWQALNSRVNIQLTDYQLRQVQSLNDTISSDDVQAIYWPIIQLLNLHMSCHRYTKQALDNYLMCTPTKTPYIIGIAGSVAVGKSTTARLLKQLLAQAHPDKHVTLMTTDGFLYPNQILTEKKLMHRKGFPESYDMNRLIQFLSDVKNGKPGIQIPTYSHTIYDIVPNQYITIDQPDILIVEGINVLQLPSNDTIFVSDFFDFSFYVDATPRLIEKWYIERLHLLLDTAFQNPESYYHRLASMPRNEAVQYAKQIWETVNLVNLYDYILPTRSRANLVLHKTHDHYIDYIYVKKR